VNESGSVEIYLVAMDAIDFRMGGKYLQYHKNLMLREINKAFCAFSENNPKKIPCATGNWGCGAFLGDPKYKSILQLISASEAETPLTYCPFDKKQLIIELKQIYDLLVKNGVTVGQLFKLLLNFESVAEEPNSDIFEYLQKNCPQSLDAS